MNPQAAINHVALKMDADKLKEAYVMLRQEGIAHTRALRYMIERWQGIASRSGDWLSAVDWPAVILFISQDWATQWDQSGHLVPPMPRPRKIGFTV